MSGVKAVPGCPVIPLRRLLEDYTEWTTGVAWHRADRGRSLVPEGHVWSRCALRGALDETGLEERRATAADARAFMRELYGEPRAFFTERKVSVLFYVAYEPLRLDLVLDFHKHDKYDPIESVCLPATLGARQPLVL